MALSLTFGEIVDRPSRVPDCDEEEEEASASIKRYLIT